MDLYTLLASLVPAEYVVYVAALFGVCAVVAANVPEPSNRYLAAAWRVVNWLGQNYRHASNAPKPTAPAPAAPSAIPAEPTKPAA